VESFYLALFDARRIASEVDLSKRHHQPLPRRRRGPFGRLRRLAS
jgi:hypothetical protein